MGFCRGWMGPNIYQPVCTPQPNRRVPFFPLPVFPFLSSALSSGFLGLISTPLPPNDASFTRRLALCSRRFPYSPCTSFSRVPTLRHGQHRAPTRDQTLTSRAQARGRIRTTQTSARTRTPTTPTRIITLTSIHHAPIRFHRGRVGGRCRVTAATRSTLHSPSLPSAMTDTETRICLLAHPRHPYTNITISRFRLV